MRRILELGLGFVPKGTCLPDLFQGCEQFRPVPESLGKVIGLQPPAKILAREKLDQVRQWNDAIFGGRIKADPVTNVFFRPEEVHGASGITDVFVPIPKWNGHVPHDTFRFGIQNNSISHLHPNRQPAIQTWCIYPHRFPWKEPADCQRFEPSLGKPLLLAVDGYSVLGGKIIEWGKGGDEICLGK